MKGVSMTAVDVRVSEARKGFQSLDVPGQYKDDALEWLTRWMTDPAFHDYVPQITYLIETEHWGFLLDAFYQVIPFGTGGRRGLVGIGPNRINPWTIRSSAQGHAQYLIKQFGDEARRRGIVLTYDVRRFSETAPYAEDRPNPVKDLNGRDLAEAAAEVYAANGIRVYMFDDVRSTPQLSFTIRHLGCISGDMFSASHNLPTDNGKKVYDHFGGQLIPPDDQILVDEVSDHVAEILTLPYPEALAQGLVQPIGEDVDHAYHQAVAALSCSGERAIRLLYSPLHGTGLTSVYPILQQLGFDVSLDPATGNLSGAFENVTFHIPNPEVRQSFDSALPHAETIQADLILSTDPDADRIGVMVRHKNAWVFLNGNEIGILLTHYGIRQAHAHGGSGADSTIIKTDVTTSLIARIAESNGVRCIGDLLVGFKYIGAEMNRLETDGRMQGFILGTEESHGYLMGNYARDKDAAGAAIWIAEYAAELKQSGITLVDQLDRIYADHGYCHNELTEIRLLGAVGMEQIRTIMDDLRQRSVKAFGDFNVRSKRDRWEGPPQPHLSRTDTASRNVLVFYLRDHGETSGMRVTIRPSGTEPKVKMYFEVVGKPCPIEQLDGTKTAIRKIGEDLEKAVMQHCYRILGIDFPERGFLLFWQLPLTDKLHYFEIEDDIAALKPLASRADRQEGLKTTLAFLGANPVEKIDDAFRARYGEGIRSFLDIDP
jgi:phosphoglucomutase/phosphomannomutase